MDFTKLKLDVYNKLQLLNSLYIKNSDNNNTKHNFLNEPILGGFKTNLITQISTDNINQLFNLRIDPRAKNFITTTKKVTDSSIYTYNASSYFGSELQIDYKQYKIVSLSDKSILNDITEVNCLQLLDYESDKFTEKTIYDTKGVPSKDKTTVLYTSKKNGIYNFMQGLYTLYNLFEASVWQSYVNSLKNNSFNMLEFNIPTIYRKDNKNGVTLLKKNYAVTITSSNLKTYIDYVSPTLYDTLKISANTINPFVARRILFMWIVLCNYFILTEFISKEPLPINNQTNQLILSNLVSAMFNILSQANQDILYNSINESVSATTISQVDAEKNVVSLMLFYYCINYIQTTQDASKNINTYNNYNTLIKDLNKILTNYYTQLINTKEKGTNVYTYPSLKLNDVNGKYKTDIINDISTKIKTLSVDKKKISVTDFKSSNTIKINNIINTYIKNAHANSESSSTKSVFTDLHTIISDYVNINKSRQNDINDISGLLKTGKTNLTTIQKLLEGRVSIQKTQRICEYVAICVLVLFIIIAVSILIIQMDKKTKLYACVGLIIFSLLNFLGIQLLLNSSIFIVTATPKPIESFITQTPIEAAAAKEAASKAATKAASVAQAKSMAATKAADAASKVVKAKGSKATNTEKANEQRLRTVATKAKADALVAEKTASIASSNAKAASKIVSKSVAATAKASDMAASVPNVNEFAIDTYITDFNSKIMSEASKYLENTFTLVSLLETYHAYGNINSTMQRELSYYNNIVSQLHNAQSKINNIYFSSYINTIDISALLQLLQLLTIIIAAACTAKVLTEDVENTSIGIWIACIAGVLTLIALVIYLLEINSHVRNDPIQTYWSNPDPNSFY